MATLVTGGTGTIGSNVVRELASRGHKVISIDIEPVSELGLKDIEPWAGQVTWVQGDIVDKEDLEKVAATAAIDKIIHSAAYTPYGDTEKDDCRRIIEINLEGTANLLDLARRLAVKRFLFISTAAVYAGSDPGDQPMKEDKPLNPRNTYGITKIASESLTRRYGELYGLETATLRLNQNWGPMEHVTPYRIYMALPYVWTRSVVRGEPIEAAPFGSGLTEGRLFNVEMPNVRDTAACMATALDSPKLSHQVYNISTGHPIGLHEMVSAMREACPEARFVEPIPQEDASVDRRLVVDVTRMREDLGFVPRYDLVSGLRDYVKWRRDFNFMD